MSPTGEIAHFYRHQKFAIDPVGQVLEEIGAALAAGEDVKLSGFVSFRVRDKGERVSRNPKTKEEVPIRPRRTVTFHASNMLKAHLDIGKKKPRSGQNRTGLLGVGQEVSGPRHRITAGR